MTSENNLRMLSCLTLLMASCVIGQPCRAGEPVDKRPVIVLRSSQFQLHTDLSDEKAQALMKSMGASLRVAEECWRRKSREQIVCYVVDDLNNWSDSQLPHPLARVWVEGVEGATISSINAVPAAVSNKTEVYASSRPGVAEHEIVHAYCCQTFGATGPDWYKEGMAQLIAATEGHVCSEGLVRQFREIRERNTASIAEMITPSRFTAQLGRTFETLLYNRRNKHVPISDWTDEDAVMVKEVRQHYVQCWALCHLMHNNPNYRKRFRMLGDVYLRAGKGSFESLFQARANELMFEYRFFLERMTPGYRVDLCHWEWEKRFRPLRTNGIARNIEARRGYQASGLQVTAGRRYEFTTQGQWTTSPNLAPTSTTGDAQGRGKLEGVVMSGRQLGAPFELSEKDGFVPPESGDLYLRCQDEWGRLGDNAGAVRVEFNRTR